MHQDDCAIAHIAQYAVDDLLRGGIWLPVECINRPVNGAVAKMGS
jgi:hypothetical protein